MNIIVHLLIASSVRKSIRTQTGVKLHYAGFLYGSILPDLSEKYGQEPHFLKDSLHFVLKNAANLGAASQAQDTSYDFSRKAGIISHYLSDYFCFAHSEQYDENIYKHHLYEFFMLFLFRRGLLLFHSQKLRPTPESVPLEELIQRYTMLYNIDIHMKAMDIYYALLVSKDVLLRILWKQAGCGHYAKYESSEPTAYSLEGELNESCLFL